MGVRWEIVGRGFELPILAGKTFNFSELSDTQKAEASGRAVRVISIAQAVARVDNRYVVRLVPPPPVNAFWSLSIYSAKTFLFVENPINRYSIGDCTRGTVYGPIPRTALLHHQQVFVGSHLIASKNLAT